jgi:hypothetical protein
MIPRRSTTPFAAASFTSSLIWPVFAAADVLRRRPIRLHDPGCGGTRARRMFGRRVEGAGCLQPRAGRHAAFWPVG